MAPFDGAAPGDSRPAAASQLPKSLKLEFSKAADYGRITKLFDPAIKNVVDPHDHVYPRKDKDFRGALAAGGAGMLTDENGDVMTLTVAYHTHASDNPGPNDPYEYTEFGTGLSRLPGFGSAQLVMAALALHEWLINPPSKYLVNSIDNTNAASIRTYRDHLHWQPITDPAELDTVLNATYRNIDRDCGAGVGKPPPPAARGKETYYAFTDESLAIHARILLSFLDQGGLLNKTGQKIPVDFSGLDEAGLTRSRVEAMARGVADRAVLLAP
jgi:hypothetical protein